MIYHVLYSKVAKEDIKDIYEYIAYDLLEPATASSQIKRIIKLIKSLSEMPMRFQRYAEEPWYSLGLRVVPVDNYLVFYLPDEMKLTVNIIRVMYRGRDLKTQL